MKNVVRIIAFALISFLLISCRTSEQGMDGVSLDGFTALFDGRSLDGWQRLADGGGEGGIWVVENNALVGSQNPEREGGLLMTEQHHADFEVYAEIKVDYPLDSGLFLRIQPNILSYQLTIDYRPEGEVGALYCPGGGGFLVHNPEGKDLWRGGEYNAVRARIQSQPPKIEAWINGRKVIDFTDSLVDGQARVPEQGFVGIQVHPEGDWGTKNKVYCRKFLIKKLGE
jgi:hypothetical protein